MAKKETVTIQTHSRPGEYPFKQLGRLRASIAYEVDEVTMVARVGTNLKYGKFLELGTRNMRPRPSLRRTLMEDRTELAAIMSGQ